jgi:hypothetical protein
VIEYRFPEEKDFLLHYAKVLDQPRIEQIVRRGAVSSASDAAALAKFIWSMADRAAADRKNAVTVAGQRDLEAWTEYVFQTVRSHLLGAGYEKEWEENS